MNDFTQWIFNIGEYDIDIMEQGHKNALVVASICIVGATIAGFLAFFLPSTKNDSHLIGISLGVIYATTVLLMDRMLFDKGGSFLIAMRIVIVFALSFITSIGWGVWASDYLIIKTIDKEVEQENASGRWIEYKQMRESYEQKIENKHTLLQNAMTESPENKQLHQEIQRNIAFLEAERDSHIAKIEKYMVESKPDYSFGTKMVTFNSLPSKHKFGKFFFLAFLIEVLPLTMRGIIFFKYEIEEG